MSEQSEPFEVGDLVDFVDIDGNVRRCRVNAVIDNGPDQPSNWTAVPVDAPDLQESDLTAVIDSERLHAAQLVLNEARRIIRAVDPDW